jgi:hypothetical protein
MSFLVDCILNLPGLTGQEEESLVPRHIAAGKTNCILHQQPVVIPQ